MALIKCKECGKEISNKAKNCINCGFPIQKSFIKKNETEIILISCYGLSILGVFFASLICGLIIYGLTLTGLEKTKKKDKVLYIMFHLVGLWGCFLVATITADNLSQIIITAILMFLLFILYPHRRKKKIK